MVLAINRAYERVNSIMRQWFDNYRPTLWTTSDLSTGTAVPVFDSLYHDLIALWASYEYASENVMANANAFFNSIQILEKSLADFYGNRSYRVFTVTIAAPGVITHNSHSLISGDRVSFVTSGALPTGLSVDTFYYVVNPATDTFQVSATKDGTAITTTGSQSGTHYYFSEKRKRLRASFDSNK